MTKVLVVDDNASIREFIKIVLTAEGHTIAEASNGERAYATAVSERPDLILLDVLMPVMDGFEALKRLRENPLTEAIPVVLLTAVPANKGEREGMKWGVKHYINKPFDSEMVKAVVRVALRQASPTTDVGTGSHTSDVIRTGNVPLDKILGGGIPVGSLTLIEGVSSTGKSVLCQHFTHESLQDGHGVAYIIPGNTDGGLLTKMESIGLEASDYLQREKLRIYPLGEATSEKDPESLVASLVRAIEQLPDQYNVVVVDPITKLVSQSEGREIMGFFSSCKNLCNSGRTILLVADSYAFEQAMVIRVRSMCDANLRLSLEEVGENVVKVLEASKLRNAERNKGNTMSFEVEPGIGMRLIPVRRARM